MHRPLRALAPALLLLLGSIVAATQAATSKRWRFRLQPYKKATVQIDGKQARYKVISRDKSLALVQVTAPLADDKSPFSLKITSKGYHPIERSISLNGADSALLKKPALFVLSKESSQHRFYRAWPTGRAPKSVTFIDDRRVSVPLLNDKGIDIIDIHTGETTRIAPMRKFAKGHGFVESLVIKDHNELWISQMFHSALHVFDLTTLQLKQSIKLRGRWPKVLRYDAARDQIYSSNWGTKNVSIVDRKTRKEVSRIKIGGTPRGSWLSDDGKHLFVTQFSGPRDGDRAGRLVKVNLATKKIVGRYGARGAKRHVVRSLDDDTLFTADMSKRLVEKYAIKNGKVLAKRKVYSNPNTIVVTKQRPLLYVSCRGPNNPKGYHYKGYHFGQIHVLDTKTLDVVEKWNGGNQPTGLDISPDGKYIVSSDFLDHTIRVYEYVGQQTTSAGENKE